MKKQFLFLASLLMFVSCSNTPKSSSGSITTSDFVTSNTQTQTSNTTSSNKEDNDPNRISIIELENALDKGKSFSKNINKIDYFRKDNFRHEEITYKRYDCFYTLQGIADSYTDGFDEPDNVIGYYGYPSDGSINKFYDILKGDPAIQHARLYSINDTPSKVNELSEADANKRLDNYENNLDNFLNETYYLIKNNPEYMDIGTLKATRKNILGDDTISITASKKYTYLYQEYEAIYTIDIIVNKDGSFSQVYFKLDDSGTITINSIDLSYGDVFDKKDLDLIFDPELYFVKKLYDLNFKDVFTKDIGNALTIGNAAYLIPYHDYITTSSDFKYLPATGLDYWDINVIASSNEEVIKYDKEEECFRAVGPGKSILTIGATYNPYILEEVEVNVIYTEPESIVASDPFNQASYVAEAFTNSEITIPVSVGPYTAEQKLITYSSDETIATSYIDQEGNVKVKGVAKGNAIITVASEINPEIKKEFPITVIGELKEEMFLGSWYDTSLYSQFKIKFAYQFNQDKTGILTMVGQDDYGVEQTFKVNFTFELNVETQDLILTYDKKQYSYVNPDLLTVHYFNSSFLRSHFSSGDYYFNINLQRGIME